MDFEENCTLVQIPLSPSIRLWGRRLSIGDHAERVTGSVVSANYFDAFGMRPILGTRDSKPG